MTDTARTHHQALGRYGERSPPTTWSRRGWWCSTATGGVTRARSTWCSGTGRRWWSCEVKTRTQRCARHARTRRSPTPSSTRLRRLATRWLRGRAASGRACTGRPGRACCARRGARDRRPRAGDRLMPFATAHTVSLHGARRPPDRRPGRRVARSGGHYPGRPAPTPRSTRPATAAGWRSSTAACRGRPPGGSRSCSRPADLLKRGTHFDLAIAVSVLAAAAGFPRPRSRRRRSSASSRSTAACGRCPASCRWSWPRPSAVSAGSSCPSRRPARRRWCPAWSCSACGPSARSSRSSAARRCPRRRRSRRCPAAGCSRWRGQERLEELDLADLFGMADATYAVEVAAAGGHHLLLSGPKGCGQDQPRRADPRVLPDLTHAESLELTAIHSLAGRLDPGDGHAHPAAVLRAPPRRQQGQPDRWRHRSGPARRDQPGPLRGAVPRRVPALRTDVIEALRQPLESGEITVARGDESVTLPARAMVVLRGQPLPVRRLPSRRAVNRCRCRETQRRDYRRRVAADRRPDRHHPAPRAAAAPRPARPVSRERALGGGAGAGGAAARATPGRALCGMELAAERPGSGPSLREQWPLADGRPAGTTTGCTPAG